MNYFSVANSITIIGIVLAIAGAIIYPSNYELVFALFVGSALTDCLDGWVARKIERKHPGRGITAIGQVLDPIRDKLLLLLVLVLLYPVVVVVVLLFLEIITARYSWKVRIRSGRHIVTRESKIVTSMQFIILGVVYLFPETLNPSIFMLAGSTLLRLSSYLQKLREYKQSTNLQQTSSN